MNIPYSARPQWHHPDGASPFIFKTEQPLLATTPWTVRYGEDGVRVFRSRRAAQAWATTHFDLLVAGINPSTGEAQ